MTVVARVTTLHSKYRPSIAQSENLWLLGTLALSYTYREKNVAGGKHTCCLLRESSGVRVKLKEEELKAREKEIEMMEANLEERQMKVRSMAKKESDD